MGPTLVALAFAGVAHAPGTTDFSGGANADDTLAWKSGGPDLSNSAPAAVPAAAATIFERRRSGSR